MRDLHFPGRSTVHGTQGMAATSHPAATLAAVEMLGAGGSAADAAIAASAMQCVVEPMSTGIGGDCFVLHATGDGEVTGLNGSGRAPAAATPGWYAARGIAEIGLDSVHSVTIPGAVDAWARLSAAHGRLGLDRCLAPAIDAAERGFAVSPRVARDWRLLEKRLAKHDGARTLYLPAGRAPETGEVFATPALGATLRRVAAEGPAGFYEGPVAESLLRTLTAAGGLHTPEDFAATAGEWVSPIGTPFGGLDVLELPPNGQGLTALLMLNVLKRFDLASLDPASAARFHLQIEAQRLAYEVRDAHIADPSFADVPVERLLSDGFAEELAARIDPDRALDGIAEAAGPVYRDTVYIAVVDADGNACSFINSLYFGFGSGIADADSGVIFQNRGAGFRLDPDHPNCIAGGKRPLHTIIPALAFRDGKLAHCFGVMGGAYQPVGHVQMLLDMEIYGRDPQEALDGPRLFHTEGEVACERSVPASVREGLAARGHRVADAAMPWGGGQIVSVAETGTLIGASDPRKDGCAIGF